MFAYQKRLQFPINIKKKDLKMAKFLLSQYGGPYGELAASLQYLNQRFTMPDGRGKALLTDIGTEELGHIEMICTMVQQLMKGATPKELRDAGLGGHYAQLDHALYPTDANGVPFTITYTQATGDVISDLESNMAAEQRARATYEHLMDLTDDKDVLEPLSFLRQREIVHYARFKELRDIYKKEMKR